MGQATRLLRPRRSSTSPITTGSAVRSRCAAASGCAARTREGTMCPSYMVTREEAHSTRGRANTLRLAMAGQLGDAKLSDKGVHDVLDLCLECRACKSECPVGVDVARFKSEFLAGYWERHGMSLAAHVFGGAPAAAAWGSRFAPFSNAVAGTRIARWAAEKLTGIDRRRSLPQWTRQTLRKRIRDQGAGIGDQGNRALLFADTFTNHADPEIGLAAIDVMNAAGITAARRTQCLLRPSADFAGTSVGRAPARGRQRSRALRRGRNAATPSSSWNRVACRRSVKTPRICLRGELQRRARVDRASRGAVRRVPRGRVRRGPRDARP